MAAAAAAAAQSGHIRKRAFQPSINSYFHGSQRSSSAPESTRSALAPPLPADMQASLLSVGMRVRKSVPEGYKTHKTLGQIEYPFPSTAPVRAMEYSLSSSSTRELMPFCGLHKTGGWRAQEIPTSSAPAAMEGTEDEIPGLTISQSTLASAQDNFVSTNVARAPSSRKRTYDEEVEDEMDALFDDIRVGPVTQPSQRPMAKMKQPAKPSAHRVVRVFGEDDFEDAAFLAPVEGMDTG